MFEELLLWTLCSSESASSLLELLEDCVISLCSSLVMLLKAINSPIGIGCSSTSNSASVPTEITCSSSSSSSSSSLSSNHQHPFNLNSPLGSGSSTIPSTSRYSSPACFLPPASGKPSSLASYRSRSPPDLSNSSPSGPSTSARSVA